MAWHQHSLETVAMVAVPGGDIQYRSYRPHNDEAAARTPLLITHGGPGGSSIGLYDALHSIADQRPLICYDQLGSCCSPADLSADQMTLSRFAVEPLRLLDALELDTVHLLGHSWGGTVMAEFALQHPHRVSRLVLSSPLLSTARWLADCSLLLAALKKEGQAQAEVEAAFDRHHFCRLPTPPELLRRDQQRSNGHLYRTMWGEAEFRANGLLADVDLFPRLASLQASTLLLCGDYDTATPHTLDQARQCIGAHAALVVLANAGHKTYIDAHQAYLDAVNGFLAETDAI